MFRITLIVLFCLVCVHAQIATKSCAETRGAQPCICNNPGLNPNGCICRDDNCLKGKAITCASQCGNGVVNENSNTSFYHITRNERTCGMATGCDEFDLGQQYKTCSEVCDSGAALGTFKNGVCCTRGCQSTRSIGEFNMWNIVPLQCQTPADCLDAPGHTITCEPARRPWEGSWCKYVPNAGTIPFISVNGKQVCPVYPCFTTKWSFGSCMKNLDKDSRAAMTNPFQGGGSWYGMNIYDGTCNQPTSRCWTKPSCHRGTLTAVPITTTTVSFSAPPSVPVVNNCAAPIPLSTVTNLVTTSPADLGYTWTYESDTCPGTITQDGDNLLITGASGSFSCSITTSLRSECNVLFNPAPVTVQFNC